MTQVIPKMRMFLVTVDGLGVFQMRWSAVRVAAAVAVTVAVTVALLDSASAEISQGNVDIQKLIPEKKTLNLAGIFPISGTEGWQGGQVKLR